MTAQDPIVSLDGISKRFGDAVAIHHLTMDIQPGEFVTFLGPSGCGKSTTLRILGGFESPDTGRIVLDGEDVTRLPPNRRKVNMVFQDYALFPHMTVRQNMSFGLELKGLGKAQIAARLDELMSFLELGQFAGRYPDQLSGGQRQRVALARALAPDPALLLLDEPLGALDAKLRSQVQDELKSIQRRTGKTFIFVTHDQDEALTMSDRIVVMNAGRVEQDGTPQELYLHPASRFVAGFLGETNLLPVEVRGTENGDISLDWSGVALRGHTLGTAPGAGEALTASLRLENLAVTRERPDTGNAVEARVTRQTFKGSRVAVDLRVPGARDAALTAYLDPGAAGALDDGPVWVGFEPKHLAVLRD